MEGRPRDDRAMPDDSASDGPPTAPATEPPATDPRIETDRGGSTDPTLAASKPRDAAQAIESRALPARYRHAGSLGSGGMGEVLLATDTQLGREVAIKRMLIAPTPPSVARFLREAKVQARLDHPAIVPVYELADDAAGRPFFVMKRLAGTTLADVLARRDSDPRYTRQKLLRAFADVCLAIELAHSRGVIHRDLKPANVMLGDFGEVYVLDWGIARVPGESDPSGRQIPIEKLAPSTGDASELTEAGALLGTPGYMAPELIRGEPIDDRADVFALGSILFEILTREPLFPRRNAIAAALGDFDPRPGTRSPDRDIPPELDAACAAATAADRDRRPTARMLAEMIERFLDGDRDLAQRKGLAVAHLDAARAALAAGDGEAERALAMREAGRALALDPTSGAADLLGRLMLEPPKETPREVETRLLDADDHAGRTKARAFLPAYFVALAVTPVMAMIGLHGTFAIALYCAGLLINVLTSLFVIRKKQRTTALHLYLGTTSTSFLIIAAAWLFGPETVAPGIAIVSMVMYSSDPRLRIGILAVLTIIPATLPILLDLAGVWPSQIRAHAGDLVIHTEHYTASMPGTSLSLAGFALLVIAASGAATRRLALNERAALRAVELQAWHLRQLVRG
ncbi:MAG: Serine/threonine-protein kinase PknB [Myxococcales bacterium]|nr:Serine/threonine-protein kinase PknB [Myxococcales bacterium]